MLINIKSFPAKTFPRLSNLQRCRQIIFWVCLLSLSNLTLNVDLINAQTQDMKIDTPRLPGLTDPNAFLPLVAEPFRMELNLSRRQVTLMIKGKPFRTYPVAIGRPGWETPVGKYKVRNMMKNPDWINPFTGEIIPGGDPDNPLGNRWIGFWTDGKNQIGFHGTPSRGSIGQAVSHGCVRMYEEHIEEIFQMIPMDTPIIVTR
jgi:L,D-transpeptidase ErfK/SrfK